MKKTLTKKTPTIGIVQLATYTSPKIVEQRGQDYVSYGADNNYFGYLQDRINGSPTNNAIVNSISQMIYGKGLDSFEQKEKPLEFAEAKMLFDDETVERLCSDLKAMGQCALQVIYSIDKTRILECNHFPIETLRSGKCNDDGKIEQYFYSDDWKDKRKKPTVISAFGFGTVTSDVVNIEEILYIKPYKSGFYFYSPVDYQGALQYAESEEEISNFHLNNIKSGLTPGLLINFNNGTPTETEQKDIERSITQKFSGTSNAGRFILSFNDDVNTAATITPVQLSDAHKQYQFLSDECTKKIMISHRVISPMLLGIKDNTGFGNNADELKTATILMENVVIQPFRILLLKGFKRVLNFNKNNVSLYFKSLQPLDLENELTIDEESNTITDNINSLSPLVANKVLESMQKDEIRGLVGLQPDASLNANLSSVIDLSEFGETVDLELYELIDSRAVDYDKENELDTCLTVHLTSVSTGPARGNARSIEDSPIYKVRYRYDGNLSPEREFCKAMLNSDKIYRKEDIEAMSQKNVNPGFGMNPDPNNPYDIFLWKGGGKLSKNFKFGTCQHFWVRETYARIDRQGKVDVYSPLADIVTPAQSRKENGFIPTANDARAYIAPHDM